MRVFQGVEYHNCDCLTEEEVRIVANWCEATEEQRDVIRRKYNWNHTDIFAVSKS